MTAQFQINRSANNLVTVGFGVNELASALVIGKNVGSVFSRREDAHLFHVLETQHNVRIRFLPAWIENAILARQVSAHAAALRIIRNIEAMQDVSVHELAGIATLLVLILRSVQSKPEIVAMLERLLIGGLGAIVDPGQLENGIPYIVKPLLVNFVHATLDSDADSAQRRMSRKWFTELAMIVGTWRQPKIRSMRDKSVIVFVSELFGAANTEEEKERQLRGGYTESFRPPKDKIRIHNTVDIATAYMSLAARSNGIDCVVEIMQADDQAVRLPNGCRMSPSTFLVRLWICQPPEEIASILRFAGSVPNNTYMEGNSFDSETEENELTIFGGDLEISTWVALKVGYQPGSLPEDQQQFAAASLWKKGRSMASHCPWTVKKATRWSYPLRLILDTTPLKEHKKTRAVGDLVQRFRNAHGKLAAISTAVSTVVHELYEYEEYPPDCDQDGEWLAGMMLAAYAMVVESLDKLVGIQGDDSKQQTRFALSLLALKDNGALHQVLLQAFTQEGISLHKLLWAAATLWGGASLKTQGNTMVDDGVLGIVAPECTILIDMLRDPLAFVRKGLDAKLFRICYGAMPMFPRDPRSGFLKSSQNLSSKEASPVVSNTYEQFPMSWMREPDRAAARGDAGARIDFAGRGETLSDLVITFEPVISDTSRGLFCAWYQGNLAFELSPATVLINAMKRATDNWKPDFNIARTDGPLKYQMISQMELLDIQEFKVDKACGVFNCYGLAGWAVAILGLAEVRVVLCREIPNEDQLKDKLEEGDVVVLFRR